MPSPRRHIEVCIATGGLFAAAVAPSHAGVSVPQVVSAPTALLAWHVAKPEEKPAAKRVPPLTGAHGLTPTATDLAHRIQRRWPVESISGVRPCDRYREHCRGIALDVMVTPTVGDEVAAGLLEDPAVRYVLWEQQIRYPDGRTRAMADRGSRTQNHFDHIHVAVR